MVAFLTRDQTPDCRISLVASRMFWLFRLMIRPLQRLLVKLYEWLASADSSSDGDLIFALAGRQNRKVYALEMFSQGRAPQVLLSVGRFEVRRFDDLGLSVRLNLRQKAASVAPMRRYFFVYLADSRSEVEFIDKGRFGTLSEIRALKTWLASHSEIKSVLIVSSSTHLRRVRLCCRSVLPASVRYRLLASRGEGKGSQAESWWRDGETRCLVLSEFPKLLLYWLVLHFRPTTWNLAPRFRHYDGSVVRKRSSLLNE
jgi:uncharacterized SAM-binding protein YcdF (DUF218 family)